MSMEDCLRIAIAGLGRIGKQHALHFAHHVPRARLVAVSTPDGTERAWAREYLAKAYGTRVFADYEEMVDLTCETGLDAVVIASVTSVHAKQVSKALACHLHVLCEKPLGPSPEVCRDLLDAAKCKPHLKVMCGFSRRFDASYRDAKQKVDVGLIGRPAVFRSQTCDKLDETGAFLKYAKGSGGIFVDCAIHDIDLALWFFGQDAKIKSVTAAGVTAVHHDLKSSNDRDNAVGIIEFYGEQVAHLFCSRIMAAGQEDSTEIIGTHGKVTVNMQPQLNLVAIHDATGIRRELPQTYFDRFHTAFLTEANEFVAACLDNTPLPMGLETSVKAVEIASALQESLTYGCPVWFDELGNQKGKATVTGHPATMGRRYMMIELPN